MALTALVAGKAERCDLLARHDAGGKLRQRHAGCLGDERHGTRGAGIGLDNVDHRILDGELDVDKADDAQALRQAAGDVTQLRDLSLRKRERRDAAGRVAGMHAGFLDVLQDAADVHVLAVAQGVHVAFDGAFQEAVEVHRMIGRDASRFGHVLLQVLGVVGDDHAASAQNVAGADQQREADAVGNLAGFFEGRGHTGCRVGDGKLVEDGRETIAIFRQVDGLGLGAHDVHAGILQGAGKLERRLAAQGDHYPIGLLDIDDVHDVFVGKRLEVQAVGGVVVGGDRFRVAVDHDGLVTGIVQRVARVHAAVVELDALADAVRACAQDHRALLRGRTNLGSAQLVGLVVVLGKALELGCAGVNRLEHGNHAELLAARANGKLVGAGEVGDLIVGEPVALGGKQVLGRKFLELHLRNSALDGNDVGDAVQEPAVDLVRLEHLLYRPAAAEGLGNVEHAVFGGQGNQLVEALLVEGVLAVAAQAVTAVLKRAHGLAEGLFEGAADGHDLADGLHAGGKGGVRALELLEREARNLHDAVVDGGLEAGRGCLGDVVGDLVERIAHGELCSGLGNREAGGLGGKRGRA